MKKSVIFFILANLAVMSIPFWTTIPLNRQIASGKWRSQSKEDEAKLTRMDLGEITSLNVKSDSEHVGVVVTLCNRNRLTMDTAYKKFITVLPEGNELKVVFDQKKYLEWRNGGGAVSTASESYAVTDGDNVPVITLALDLKRITAVNAVNADVRIESYPADPIDNPLVAMLDSSDLQISYNDYRADTISGSYRVFGPLKYPVKVVKKNNSNLRFFYLENIDLDLKLEKDFYVIDPPVANIFKNLSISYDDASDITLNISDLNKVKLVKTK